MKTKKQARLERAARTRAKIKTRGMQRLCVHKTPRHLYAQIVAADGSGVLMSVSTLDRSVRDKSGYSGNVETATLLGTALGKRATEAGIKRVAFDRSGFKYHGRVKALAEAARKQGLEF